MSPRKETWTWHRTWELLSSADRESRPFALRQAARARPVWEPPIDVFESPEGFRILVALPGVEAANVEVLLSDGHLVVVGERSRPHVCEHLRVRRMEIPHGRFERRLELPPGRYTLGAREMVDGCLVMAFERV